MFKFLNRKLVAENNALKAQIKFLTNVQYGKFRDISELRSLINTFHVLCLANNIVIPDGLYERIKELDENISSEKYEKLCKMNINLIKFIVGNNTEISTAYALQVMAEHDMTLFCDGFVFGAKIKGEPLAFRSLSITDVFRNAVDHLASGV